MLTKICFKCGVEKPLNDFHKHPGMRDGHLNKCGECVRVYVRQHREANKEYYLNYDRNRFNAKERVTKATSRSKYKYRSDLAYKQRVLSIKRKWILENPMKRKAQCAATNAVRDGKLERKHSCEHCGATEKKLQKHHWSYLEEHWLDVVWLCPSCHGKEHKRLNALGRDPDKQIVPTQG